ncbi:hypothetical protein EUA04_16515 [Mycolicibacterium obuense]|uniref:Acetoacetate decarboxylase n=1 Tax=Mycolicibacterium obuense TaxID=1807 RepID=A0A4R5X7X5_9MYCO|nr:hypothetical protein [Mycolicibacterium obuense]TDL07506.1 hypothetical protein EUA04_16515 [Mycolicibacterium obuense]
MPRTIRSVRPLLERFEALDQVTLELDGHTTVAPLRYHSGRMMAGVFAARASALADKTPHSSLRPATIAPGVAAVVVIGFEFVTDIGPVDEVCIAVPLGPRLPGIPLATAVLRRDLPVWIWHLPVTTPIADVLGRRLWGFPKFVADVDIDPDLRSTALRRNGNNVLSMSGPALTGGTSWATRMRNHLWQNGSDVQVADHDFELDDVAISVRPGAARLDLATSDPVARDLDDVLISRSSIAYARSTGLRALLGMPQNLTPHVVDTLAEARRNPRATAWQAAGRA